MNPTTLQSWIDNVVKMAIAVCVAVTAHLVYEIQSDIHDIETKISALPAPVPGPGPLPNPGPTPAPSPGPPSSPLATTGKAYHLGSSVEYANLRDQIKSGKITTSQGVSDYMTSVAKPFGDTLHGVVAANCDSKGNITNATALASEFDVLSRNLEVK